MSDIPQTYVEKGLALYWEPATPPRFINFCYDAKVLVALEEYFGDFPITITRDDLKVLRAMQRAGGGRPLDSIIQAVEKEESIRIWWDSEKEKFDRRLRQSRGVLVRD